VQFCVVVISDLHTFFFWWGRGESYSVMTLIHIRVNSRESLSLLEHENTILRARTYVIASRRLDPPLHEGADHSPRYQLFLCSFLPEERTTGWRGGEVTQPPIQWVSGGFPWGKAPEAWS
jgi:hypothetical protein